ncbi:hypothetical protein ACLKA6_003103 [Drosophila palustris]
MTHKRSKSNELHGNRASHLQEFKVHFQLHVNLEILWAYLRCCCCCHKRVLGPGSGCGKMVQQMEPKLWSRAANAQEFHFRRVAAGLQLICAPNFRQDNANPNKKECLP